MVAYKFLGYLVQLASRNTGANVFGNFGQCIAHQQISLA